QELCHRADRFSGRLHRVCLVARPIRPIRDVRIGPGRSLRMMAGFPRTARRNAHLLLTLTFGALSTGMVRADDIAGITGLWATDARNCEKIFSKTEHGFSFAKDSDLYGSGFIIDGRRVVTPAARCEIKTSKRDG